MQKLLICFALFWGGFASLFAQNAKIHGHIYNSKKEIMPYATIMLQENVAIINGTYSDEKGEYVFFPLKAGTYSLKVSNLGYQDTWQKDIILTENETKEINIEIKDISSSSLSISMTSEKPKTMLTDSISIGGEDFSLSFRGATDGGSKYMEETDGDGVPDTFDEEPTIPISTSSTEMKRKEIKTIAALAAVTPGVSKKARSKAKGTTGDTPEEYGDFSEGAVAISSEKKGKKKAEPKKTTEETPAKISPEPVADTYAGKLTAGEVNDFAKWKMWKNISNETFKDFQNEWKMIPQSRYVVQVENEQYFPMANLKVELRSAAGEIIWTGRTDNTGKAELWAEFFQLIPQAKGNPEIIRVYFGEQSQDLKQISPFSQGINYIKIAKPCEKNLTADIAFVVDATGSMGDEIAHVRADLSMIAGNLAKELKGWEVNFASVFYKDRGDNYLTKSSPFSTKVEEAQAFMRETDYGGGGDTPEAIESGLEEAIQRLKWNENASTRIMFMVLDAPAHTDTETLMRLQMQIRAAAHKGIRVIPVACSGIDKSTEYLLRAIALATNGTYAFLTDDSGIGNAHIKPTTDNFKVEKFHELAVRLVKQYTFMPECQPVKEKPVTETVFKSEVIEKTENKAKKDKDEVLGKNEENGKVWVVQKTPSWKYFPNPTQGNLTIEVEDNIGEIFLSDVSGKILARYEVKKGESLQIDISAFANGVYFLRYEYAPDKWLSGKVILQH